MGLIKRVILSKFYRGQEGDIRSFSGNVTPSGMRGVSSGGNSIEKQTAEGSKDACGTSKKHIEEIKQFRAFKKRKAEEIATEIDTRTKKNKRVLSKQIILPESMKKQLEIKKEVKEGNDISPII